MNRSEWVCEIITPISIGSAFPKKPELRPPALKGMMRFWWRALSGDLTLAELKTEEGKIFGASDKKIGRSKFALRMQSHGLMTAEYSPVFHRNDRGGITAFAPDQQFKLILTSTGAEKQHRLYEELLTLTLVFGGLGKRSRRGFGSVQVQRLNGEIIPVIDTAEQELERMLDLLNAVKPGIFKWDKSSNKIVSAQAFTGDYPWIREITLGRLYKDYRALLQTISQASHDFASNYTGIAPVDSRKIRLASPVYVSAIKAGEGCRPVITTLHTAFQPGQQIRGKDTQQQFKEAIL
ncbi:MAG: type III-B CRISPR module RAMP protein Cmr1 [Bacillota bacterium]